MLGNRIVVPGDLICCSNATNKSGTSTYCRSGNIFSSAFGYIKEESHADGSKTVSVEPLKTAGIVPYAGAIVLAKVCSITGRFVRCDIVAVGDVYLSGPFKGLIRREDIRATQRDQAEPGCCFRPGDIVRARVINLLGPGAYTDTGSFMSSTSSQTLSTLLTTQAISCSVAATNDANISGYNSICLLSTAEPDLGVVLGFGRSPDNGFLELFGSTSGCPLVPVGWTEMLCPHTLTRYPRKVARVPDELITQLICTQLE
ncbi:Exosome complex component CSL4 [Schistosoma japonicum]|uniref:Exosome complex component CSL4 n=1 Tax=Schistosoma japonicum TaxID=6182 RepID=A0A4Z2DLJ1_SCHJA|nr:Exosome complex component CSL4 [Schistosoma japonicum]KAH8875743.1 Exosome complex component CSL4 [Schistosoma japonicum]TNN17361.1 Exosome complex component CSL4 [Schistosoma japonicum]